MAETNGDGPMPRWFIRLVLGFMFSLMVAGVGGCTTLGVQLIGGVWWAATITAKVDAIQTSTSQTASQHDKQIEQLDDGLERLETEHREDHKFTGDQIANLKRDLALYIQATAQGVAAQPKGAPE